MHMPEKENAAFDIAYFSLFALPLSYSDLDDRRLCALQQVRSLLLRHGGKDVQVSHHYDTKHLCVSSLFDAHVPPIQLVNGMWEIDDTEYSRIDSGHRRRSRCIQFIVLGKTTFRSGEVALYGGTHVDRFRKLIKAHRRLYGKITVPLIVDTGIPIVDAFFRVIIVGLVRDIKSIMGGAQSPSVFGDDDENVLQILLKVYPDFMEILKVIGDMWRAADLGQNTRGEERHIRMMMRSVCQSELFDEYKDLKVELNVFVKIVEDESDGDFWPIRQKNIRGAGETTRKKMLFGDKESMTPSEQIIDYRDRNIAQFHRLQDSAAPLLSTVAFSIFVFIMRYALLNVDATEVGGLILMFIVPLFTGAGFFYSLAAYNPQNMRLTKFLSKMLIKRTETMDDTTREDRGEQFALENYDTNLSDYNKQLEFFCADNLAQFIYSRHTSRGYGRPSRTDTENAKVILDYAGRIKKRHYWMQRCFFSYGIALGLCVFLMTPIPLERILTRLMDIDLSITGVFADRLLPELDIFTNFFK